MIFRRRRPILIGSLVMVLVAAVFALPVFGELGNENDFDDPNAEAVAGRVGGEDATRAQATPTQKAHERVGAGPRSARAVLNVRKRKEPRVEGKQALPARGGGKSIVAHRNQRRRALQGGAAIQQRLYAVVAGPRAGRPQVPGAPPRPLQRDAGRQVLS